MYNIFNWNVIYLFICLFYLFKFSIFFTTFDIWFSYLWREDKYPIHSQITYNYVNLKLVSLFFFLVARHYEMQAYHSTSCLFTLDK